MRIDVKRSDLSAVLSSVCRVVEARSIVPILVNVLLTSTADRLSVRGTDQEVEISSSCEAACEPGTITIEAKALRSIVSKVVGDMVNLELVGPDGKQDLIVKSGRSRFKLPTMPAGSFPSMSFGAVADTISFNPAEMLEPVSFAAAVGDMPRAGLNGVHLHEHDGLLRAVATDGHRLVAKDGGAIQPFTPVTLPRKVVGILAGITDQVQFELSSDKVRVTVGNTIITSRLIETKYINYLSFWPADNAGVLIVDRADLRGAVQRTTLVADGAGGRGIKLSLAPDTVTLSLRGTTGESQEEVEAEYVGEPIDLGFAVAYLDEFLSHIPGEKVRVEVGGAVGNNFSGDTGWSGVLMKYLV